LEEKKRGKKWEKKRKKNQIEGRTQITSYFEMLINFTANAFHFVRNYTSKNNEYDKNPFLAI